MESARPPSSRSIYNSFAGLYNYVFGFFFRAHIRRIIGETSIKPLSKVLEVGVGTGVSLEFYPEQIEVTGIDISHEMLALARIQAKKLGRQNIQLVQMNAEKLIFDTGSFDLVLAFHVASVVSNVDAFVAEMIRVTKVGGRIIVVNYFTGESQANRAFNTLLNPITKNLGWRTTLRVQDITRFPELKLASKKRCRMIFEHLVFERRP